MFVSPRDALRPSVALQGGGASAARGGDGARERDAHAHRQQGGADAPARGGAQEAGGGGGEADERGGGQCLCQLTLTFVALSLASFLRVLNFVALSTFCFGKFSSVVKRHLEF